MVANVAIRTSPTVVYPSPEELGPPEPYPEYPFRSLGASALSPRNEVYPLVRQCLRDLGCDAENFGSERWNPLGRWIRRGQRVFILPNFVKNPRADESHKEFESKCTHASVLRAVVDYAVIAAGDA